MNNRGPYSGKIVIKDGALSRDICSEVINFYGLNERNIKVHGDTYPLFIDPGQGSVVREVVMGIQNQAHLLFGEGLVVDYAEVVRWPVGSFQLPHYDDTMDETVLTSITYLNEGYGGGNTYIEGDMVINSRMGRTVWFDGNYYLHGVQEVTGIDRYTIPVWYRMAG